MKTIQDAEVGGNPRRDVFAVRADGAEVRLTSDPTMEYWMPDWVPDEKMRPRCFWASSSRTYGTG